MLHVFFWVIPRRLNFIYLLAYEDGTDSVPKRRLIKFRRRGSSQKKTYNNLLLFVITRVLNAIAICASRKSFRVAVTLLVSQFTMHLSFSFGPEQTDMCRPLTGCHVR
jgi:hypothetical protein